MGKEKEEKRKKEKDKERYEDYYFNQFVKHDLRPILED
jgi:hypothetical protein